MEVASFRTKSHNLLDMELTEKELTRLKERFEAAKENENRD